MPITAEQALAAIHEAIRAGLPEKQPAASNSSEPESLKDILAEFAPYDQMPEFIEGYDDQCSGMRHQRYSGLKAQAYDRGACAAYRFERLQYKRLSRVA